MLVIKAIQFAAQKHFGQERNDTYLPYIVHPMTVMHLTSKYKKDSKNLENLQCAALLHDTLEDTDCSYSELEREFNPMVASIVLELTNDDEKIKELGKNEYLKGKMIGMSKYAFLLKLIDRLANVSDTPRIKYVENTLDMMTNLRNNRKGLTATQLRVISEIEKVCLEFRKF